jgi:hypothetical protein
MPNPTRRSLLTLASGTVGTAGCLHGEDQSAGTAADQSRPAATATRRTGQGSGRIAGVVYYDSSNRGPYTDLEDALADVPDGGVLQLGPTTYDVATEGRIALDRPVHVRGAGWAQVFPDPDSFENETVGTRVLNTGDDAVDEPVLEYDAGSKKELKNVVLDSLHVGHTGDAPAIRFRDTSRSLMRRCEVNCGWEAPVGVKYEGAAYLANQIQNVVKGFRDIGIHVQGTGYGHEFHQSVAATGVENATALQTEVQRTIVVGGEYMAHEGSEGTAIKFFRRQGGLPAHGGLVIEPGIERTANPVVIDGDAPFDGVQLYHVYATLGERGVERLVRFGNAADCKLVNPVVPRNDTGELAHWTEQAENCTVVTDPDTLARARLRDDGSRNPYVEVVGSATADQLREFPTGVPTSVGFAPEWGSPLFHDGHAWHRSASREISL